MHFSITVGDLLLIISMIGGFITAVVKILNNQNQNNTELHTALLEIKYQISLIQLSIERLDKDVETNKDTIQILTDALKELEERLARLEGAYYGN